MDKNIRNTKWWWSLVFWSFGNLLVNTCIICVTAHVRVWLTCEDAEKDKKKHLLFHYDFNSAIAMEFFDPSGLSRDIKNHGELQNTTDSTVQEEDSVTCERYSNRFIPIK